MKAADIKKPAAINKAARITPAFAPMKDWCAISGMTKGKTYAALGRGDLRAKKEGKRLLIDVTHGLRYLRSLPNAHVAPPRPHSRRAVADQVGILRHA